MLGLKKTVVQKAKVFKWSEWSEMVRACVEEG